MLSPLIGSDRYFNKNGQPILFNNAYQAQISDQHGNKYTDFILGLGPVIIGHSDEEFNERISEHLVRGLSFPGFAEVHTELSNVYEENYEEHKVVSLFKTSSEAVTAAIRCAMLETGKKQVIRCGFLGWHDSQLASSPSWHEWPSSIKRNQLRFSEGMRGVEDNQAVYNWIDGDINSLNHLLLQHAKATAAFAIDVYQLAFMPLDTLKKAVKLCRQFGVKIILDETKTAGRLRAGGYVNTNEIYAGYIVLGKAIGNGLPLSVLMGKQENIDIYRKARIGGTHSKETLSAKSGVIVADIMTKREGYIRIPMICNKIVSSLNYAITLSKTQELLSAVSLIGDSLFDLRFTDKVINDFKAREDLKAELIEQGIFMLQGHNSFVCLAHEFIDFGELENKFYIALTNWSKRL